MDFGPIRCSRGLQALMIVVHGLTNMGFVGLFHRICIIYRGPISHSIQKNGCSGAHLVIPRILAPKLLKTSTGTMSSYASCSGRNGSGFSPTYDLVTKGWFPFLVTLFSLKLTLRTRKWIVGIRSFPLRCWPIFRGDAC